MKEEIKLNKSQVRINILKWQKEVTNKVKELYNRISPTIKDWKIKDLNDETINDIQEYCTDKLLYKSLDDLLIDENAGNKNKVNINYNDKYIDIIKDFTITDFKIWNYIISKLELGSNKFKCDYDDLANYLEICTGAAYVAMNNFISRYNSILIQKTNSSGIFIINHNIVIRGSYIMFNSLYVCLYENIYAGIDDRGRAIIK